MSDNMIQLNKDLIKHGLKGLVRSSVEETLNALLDKEADELANPQKYGRSSGRQGYHSGHYKRNFQTTAREMELNVPKLKSVPFEAAIIERYRPGDPLWKKPGSGCIWRAPLYAGQKKSPKPFGGSKYLPGLSAMHRSFLPEYLPCYAPQ